MSRRDAATETGARGRRSRVPVSANDLWRFAAAFV